MLQHTFQAVDLPQKSLLHSKANVINYTHIENADKRF